MSSNLIPAGGGGSSDLLDPAMVQKVSQMTHMSVEALLQWIIKNLVPVVMRGLAIELGSMGNLGAPPGMGAAPSMPSPPQKAPQTMSPSLKGVSNILGSELDTRSFASIAGATAPALEKDSGRRYFLNPTAPESAEQQKISAVAAKLSDEIGIKALVKR